MVSDEMMEEIFENMPTVKIQGHGIYLEEGKLSIPLDAFKKEELEEQYPNLPKDTKYITIETLKELKGS